MSVRDHPSWGWFETTDFSDRTQSVKKHEYFCFPTPPCLPIEPLGGLETPIDETSILHYITCF